MKKFLWIFSESEHLVLIEAETHEEAVVKAIAKRVELANDPDYDEECCTDEFYLYDRLFSLDDAMPLSDIDKNFYLDKEQVNDETN